jgi:hypothetical protein
MGQCLPRLVSFADQNEDSVRQAGAAGVSKKFQTNGMKQFSESSEGIIKDCCPYR